ncbi:ROK family transcriptional regulator [Rhizobium chutanense]|nr:ROK family transcriptional regulator [Rhizobium chutanense]
MHADLGPRPRPVSLTDIEYAVLRHIRLHPGKSRTEIAAALGLSKSMLTKAVANFDRFKLVREERATLDDGERGQPPLRLSLNDDAFHSIGLYVRQGYYAVTRSDLSGNIRERVARQVDAVIEPILDDIARLIAGSPSPILGVGHAVPAIVGEDGTLFEVTPTQAALPLQELAETISARFRLPVYWDNGAYCVAAFEAQRPRTNHRGLFYITLDFGVGGGLFAKDAVFRGAHNQAANIGALIPETGDRPSLPDLARHLGRPLDRLSDDFLARLFLDGDRRLLDWIDDRGEKLSKPLATVVQLFNPDAIVVGGFFPREILERLCARVDLGALDVPGRRPLIRPTLLVTQLLGPAGLAEAASLLPIAAEMLGQHPPMANARRPR